MANIQDKNKARQKEQEKAALRRSQRGKGIRMQLIGILAGGGLGWVAYYVYPGLGQGMDTLEAVLWGASLGGVLASLPAFERAGAALTRRDNRLLNLSVSLGILALVLALLSVWLLP